MKTRAITGFFFVAIMLGSLLFGAYVFAAFYFLLAAASLTEFYKLFSSEIAREGQWVGLGLGLAGLAASMCYLLGFVPISFLTPLPLLVPAILIFYLFRRDLDPFTQIARIVLGWAYVLTPFFCFFALGFLMQNISSDAVSLVDPIGGYHYGLPMGLLLLIWANDTGAYILGRAFGRHKLFERVSPGKTWEGFGGGLISALIVGTVLYRYLDLLSINQWLLIAGAVSVIGTLGDLVESMLKRNLGIKDSGGILPGHGGLLDRFDSLLLVAPVVYVLSSLLPSL